MKNAPDPPKSCMGSKKCHMRQEYLQAIETISKYKWTNALGFELQSAPNLHRDKKNQSFELQSAPNLHRDKKTKVLNFKVHQTCTGTKKTKTSQSTWEGATIPLKFLFFCFFLSLCRFGALWSSKLLFFLSLCRFGALWSSKLLFFLSLCRFGALWSSKHVFFFVPVQVWCTLKFKTFVFLSLCRFGALWSSSVFFVPVQVWCTLQLKPSVCFVPVEVGMTHGLLSKCLISQGIGIVCLKVMFFHCFCWFPDSGFFSK